MGILLERLKGMVEEFANTVDEYDSSKNALEDEKDELKGLAGDVVHSTEREDVDDIESSIEQFEYKVQDFRYALNEVEDNKNQVKRKLKEMQKIEKRLKLKGKKSLVKPLLKEFEDVLEDIL